MFSSKLIDLLKGIRSVRQVVTHLEVADDYSDQDFWVYVDSGASGKTIREIADLVQLTNGQIEITEQRRLAWFGLFLSLYEPLNDSQIDIGITEFPNNIRAGGQFRLLYLRDADAAGEFIQEYEQYEPLCLPAIVHQLRKLRNAIVRGYLWNSLELIQRLRRSLFCEIARLKGVARLYDRPDRNAESWSDEAHEYRLRKTAPGYDNTQICHAAHQICLLFREVIVVDDSAMALSFSAFENWFLSFPQKINE